MHADTIYRGGTILTMVDADRTAEAVAVADGRIVAIGTEADVMRTKTEDTTVVDLGGRCLLPGFIDSHSHFMNATQVVRWANVAGPPVGPVTCIADILDVLRGHVERHRPAAGEWIIGYGYDRSNLAEARELEAADLDPSFPDHPIMLIHSSNHGAVLNSCAFGSVGIGEHTETPPGGVINRVPGTNRPAGFIMETAFIPLFSNLQKPGEAELLETLDAAQQIYAGAGVTTCQEGATHLADLEFLRTGAAQGRLYLDLVCLPFMMEVPAMVKEYFPDFRGAPHEIPDTAHEHFGTSRDRLKLQGVKFVIDGSPQGKTAFWTEPLLTAGPGGEDNWRGQPLLPPETLVKMMGETFAKGIQVFIHANGDAAIDLAIDAARAAGVRADDDRRTVIIHSQCMRPDQLDTYVELGFSPSFFTMHTFFWGTEHTTNLGERRASFLSPMRSALERGIRCSNHSDFSVTPMDPMRIVWSSVTRRSREGAVIGPDQRVDRWSALRALTIDAAWQIREEDAKGTLEVGKLADLVILDADPLQVDEDAILDISVVETLKEGRRVFPA